VASTIQNGRPRRVREPDAFDEERPQFSLPETP